MTSCFLGQPLSYTSLALAGFEEQAALWKGPGGTELKATSSQPPERQVLSPITCKERNPSSKHTFGSRPFSRHTWDETAATAGTSVTAL